MSDIKELFIKTSPLSMRVLIDRPPNYENILKVLPDANKEGVLFCYGDCIYNPSNVDISPWILEHEKVHSYYQLQDDKDCWWIDYLSNADFRFQEELIAHKIEYFIFRKYIKSDNKRRQYLFEISKRLSSPLYSAGRSQADCRRAILL